MSSETGPEKDNFSIYLNQASCYERLDRDAGEEADLIKRIEAGREAAAILETEARPEEHQAALESVVEQGEHAKNRLIEANLGLVGFFAKRYKGLGVEYEDLIQAGNESLVWAAKKVEMRGYTFATFAGECIINNMRKTLFNEALTIRVPAYALSAVKKYKDQLETGEVDEGLERSLLYSPGGSPIIVGVEAAQSNVSFSELKSQKRYYRLFRVATGYRGEVSPDDEQLDDFSVEEVLGGLAVESAENAAVRKMTVEEVRQAVQQLPARERQILSIRFGLDDDEANTLEEVGRRIGVTRERTRQLEGGALAKLRSKTDSFPKLHAARERVYATTEEDLINPETRLLYALKRCSSEMLAVKLEELIDEAGWMEHFAKFIEVRSRSYAARTVTGDGLMLYQLAPDVESLISVETLLQLQQEFKETDESQSPKIAPITYSQALLSEAWIQDCRVTLSRLVMAVKYDRQGFENRLARAIVAESRSLQHQADTLVPGRSS